MEDFHKWIEIAASSMELLAVVGIVGTFLVATLRFLVHFRQHVGKAYEFYKVLLGRSLLLGLEFLVAADVIRTVALEPTLQNIGILGALVVIRTFLSWGLVLEMENRWPWQQMQGPTLRIEPGEK